MQDLHDINWLQDGPNQNKLQMELDTTPINGLVNGLVLGLFHPYKCIVIPPYLEADFVGGPRGLKQLPG